MKLFSSHRRAQLKCMLVDVLASIIVWLLFLIFRWLVYDGIAWGVDTIIIPALKFTRALVRYPIACLLIYYLSGYYMRPFSKPQGQVFLYTLLSALTIAAGAFFFIIINDKEVVNYERYIICLNVLFGLQFVISYVARLLLNLCCRKRYQKDRNIVIIDPEDNDTELYKQINRIYPTGAEIGIKARVYDILTGAATITELNESPVVMITKPAMNDFQMSIKRNFDIVSSLLCLVLLSPLLVVIAILIKTDSRGPVIYKQERIGMYGRPFEILKFRTMQENAEGDTPQLSAVDDSRITRVGRVLRKYRLDELPQFINVLRGDMSIVGPRPERQYYIRKIEEQAPYYCLLYKIRPGLTSWGPVKVGYTDTLEKMIRRLNYDMAYIENMSLWLDCKILVYTIKVLADGKGQ